MSRAESPDFDEVGPTQGDVYYTVLLIDLAQQTDPLFRSRFEKTKAGGRMIHLAGFALRWDRKASAVENSSCVEFYKNVGSTRKRRIRKRHRGWEKGQ